MRPTECARAPNGGFYGVFEERNEGVCWCDTNYRRYLDEGGVGAVLFSSRLLKGPMMRLV